MSTNSRNESLSPALGQKMSSLPKASTQASTIFLFSPIVRTSACTTTPLSPSSSCIAGSRSSAMSATHTFAPSRTKRSATARPMPDAPPVISATSPSSQPITPPPSESQKPVHEHHHAAVLHARLEPLQRLGGGALEHLAVDRPETRSVHRALDLAAAAHAAVAQLELRMRAVAVEHRRPLLGHRDHDVAALAH